MTFDPRTGCGEDGVAGVGGLPGEGDFRTFEGGDGTAGGRMAGSSEIKDSLSEEFLFSGARNAGPPGGIVGEGGVGGA